jgi:hypothetical protein
MHSCTNGLMQIIGHAQHMDWSLVIWLEGHANFKLATSTKSHFNSRVLSI